MPGLFSLIFGLYTRRNLCSLLLCAEIFALCLGCHIYKDQNFERRMSSIFEDPGTGNRLITSRNGIEPRNKYLTEENGTLRVRGQNMKMILYGHLSNCSKNPDFVVREMHCSLL